MPTGIIFTNTHEEPALKVPEPPRFSMDELQVERLPIPEEKWYHFELEDPASPSFCTFMKDYYGPGSQVKAFLSKRGGDLPELDFCKLIAMEQVSFPETAWEHRNVWDYDYHLEAEGITVEQALLACGDLFALCIRPVFHKLRYYDNTCVEWVPVPNYFWGHPHVMEKIGTDHVTTLFLLQKNFDTLREALEYMKNPANIRFDRACAEIFGDG